MTLYQQLIINLIFIISNCYYYFCCLFSFVVTEIVIINIILRWFFMKFPITFESFVCVCYFVSPVLAGFCTLVGVNFKFTARLSGHHRKFTLRFTCPSCVAMLCYAMWLCYVKLYILWKPCCCNHPILKTIRVGEIW